MVDGVDIRDVKQHDLRDKIGLVPQKGLLFSGTIRHTTRSEFRTISFLIITHVLIPPLITVNKQSLDIPYNLSSTHHVYPYQQFYLHPKQ